MNLNPLVHKVTIVIGLITLFFTFFGKFLPLSEELKIALVGFIGALGSFVKTFHEPPRKDGGGPPSTGVTTRIVDGLQNKLLVLLVAFVLASCSGAPPRPADLDLAGAVLRQADNVLGFLAANLPPGDAQLGAARAARVAGDLSRFFDLTRPLLEQVSAGGQPVPQAVTDDQVTGAAAAKSIEGFARALDGRDPETGEKKP